MKTIICIILSAVSLTLSAQGKKPLSTKNKKAIAAYKAGETNYMYERYQRAVLDFEDAVRYDPKFAEAYVMLSEIYGEWGDYGQQYTALERAIGLDSAVFVAGYYHAGVALCHLGRFDEATRWFDQYKRRTEGKKRKYDATAYLERALAAKELMEHPVPFDPQPLGPALQSHYDMYWPSLTLDGTGLCITVLMPKDEDLFRSNPMMEKSSRYFQEDFYMSYQENGEWQRPFALDGINTPLNEGAQTLSADGKSMFFTACGRDDGKGSCDIYYSRLTKSGWSKPVNVGSPVSTPFWESQPCFSADGETLYFVSNRPGGKGQNDVWQAKIEGWRSDGSPIFGTPVNLGDSINTAGDEASPFIHPDGRTLYYSSDGWPAVGQQDIFVSRMGDDGKWGKPRNIGYPINTAHDDNGLIVNTDGTKAYYSSEKLMANGTKKRELMCFDLPEEARPVATSYIKGHVYDARSHQALDAELELIDLQTGKRATTAHSDERTGTFVVNMPSGKDYALISQREGYLLHSQNFSLSATAKYATVELDIPMSPIAKGEKVTLRNVFFDHNSTTLKEESHIELDKLVALMKANPTMKVEIGGHTDSDGTAQYNQKLSMGRAQTTVDYLVSKGIGADRLSAHGYGMTRPVAPNDTEEGKAQNRRIEAMIVGAE